MADIIRDVDAIPGERWFPKKTTFVEDINEYWGDWGVASEVDTLKAVLLRRPGKEIENFDPKKARFSDDPVDVELLRKNGVEVDEIDVSEIVKGRGCLHCITAFLKRG